MDTSDCAASYNLYSLLTGNFGPTDAVLLESDSQLPITFGDALDAVCRLANRIRSFGVVSGDRVVVQVEKSSTAVLLYLAVLKIGAVFVPLNTTYTNEELAFFISDSEPRLVVYDPSREIYIQKIAEASGAEVATLASDGRGSLVEHLIEETAYNSVAPVTSSDLAAIVYTSGTTGRSKGAMLSHANLASNALTLHKIWRFQDGDILLHALPLYHIHGLFVALHTAFINGSKIILLSKFDAETVIDRLPEASVFMGVPTHYTRLLSSPRLDRVACGGMRLFVSGSAPLSVDTFYAFEKRSGHKILERYGMTEAGMIASNPYGEGREPGTVGFALPGVELRVTSQCEESEGRLCAPGQVGILEVCGLNVFRGYWKLPNRTKEEFRDENYFITGDLATIDADGRVRIVGRAKDLIISGGLNVYPKEVEAVIEGVSGVAEAAVIGVAHPDFGEGVVAIIVPEQNAMVTEMDIIGACAQLAPFKRPKKAVFAEELPRNAMGKVVKAHLRDQHAALFEATRGMSPER